MIATQYPTRILLVEDNAGDVELTRIGLEAAGFDGELTIARDGLSALEQVRSGTLPHFVLLDLNLPRLGGMDVLQAIKADPLLRRLPVFVYSGSSSRTDVQRCYDLGANGYMTKSVDMTHLLDNLRRLTSFWFEAALLPRA